MSPGVLYVITCAAPPARYVSALITQAQQDGWDTCLLATPYAVRFLDIPTLEELTGHPVRSDYKDPGEPDVLPSPDAIILAPATVNTINKWGAGICDTLALGILVEAIGKRLPVIAMPSSNYAHAAHPMFEENIRRLRSWGVTVLYGPDVLKLQPPGTGGAHASSFPWAKTLEALRNHQQA